MRTLKKILRGLSGGARAPGVDLRVALAKAILQIFGAEEQGWDEWKETAFRRYESDERQVCK